MMSGTPSFLDLALAHLDQPLQDTLRSVDKQEALEDILRFICGSETRSSGDKWDDRASKRQSDFLKAINAQLKPSELKRRRDDDSEPSETTAPKKAKLGDDIVDDSAPLFILHAISTTAPVRKKVDIVVTAASVKFVNATSQAIEAVISLSSLQRAFVVPTRGKTKPHWTVVILSSDVPDTAAPQIIFGLDAAAPANLYTTPTNGSKTAVTKGAETLPILRTLLSHFGLPNPVYETDTKVFKSAASREAIAGTEAYLGAKVGTLWFFADGVLWGEAKPCEFWPADSIVDIRVISATGRQCSATIIRRSEDEDEEGVQTGFTFLDGREQDGIRQWVKKYRKVPQGTDEQEAELVPTAGKMTINSLAMLSDSEDDDYTESDDSSDEDGEGEESEDEDGDGDGEPDSNADDDEDADPDDDEEMAGPDDELDPAHHPLMRPGAMPKMSKAAMNMVVGMMEEGLGGGVEEVDELEE
ncbi:hypothetical protein CYLTODRAFT_376949 [Cylindrobasidium torrendii FP15055 ss-10]|uniref:Histone chaperone RTT106/FACT complex subunit SPT16-like middle domain-containing protein n=1 Tax=Cylindrobasidium torrendii FP15055 ss-10 TaxID=1314674 RepID=A0A0D7B9Y0_9AGAR|nr:hypothetical protein CYLTODRAFT_376949 [Cylindrobasidium torrendii FP15055 ss-10]